MRYTTLPDVTTVEIASGSPVRLEPDTDAVVVNTTDVTSSRRALFTVTQDDPGDIPRWYGVTMGDPRIRFVRMADVEHVRTVAPRPVPPTIEQAFGVVVGAIVDEVTRAVVAAQQTGPDTEDDR